MVVFSAAGKVPVSREWLTMFSSQAGVNGV